MTPRVRVGAVSALIIGVVGCNQPATKRESTPTWAQELGIDPSRLDRYAPNLPAHYQHPAVAARDNSREAPVTDAGATLGRVLFFDPALSINDRLSCASCHHQSLGFGDTARFSLGHDGRQRTARKAMRLANARYYDGPGFFWDRRAATLESQVLDVIVNPVEFGYTPERGGPEGLMEKLRAIPRYPPLFALAFGDSTVTTARVQNALAQFVRSIVSVDSKWDRGYAMVYDSTRPARSLLADLANFTPEENLGRRIFMRTRAQGGAGCASCHVPPTFALSATSMSNGMDQGETRIFKAPSLKNVALAPPFMHEGRLSSTFQVAAYYNEFVLPGPALDPRLRGAHGRQLNLGLSSDEQLAVAAFLHTLTDSTLLSDRRFSNPFVRAATVATTPNR